MSKRAEERALEAYPTLEQAVFDEMYPRLLFTRNTERSAFVRGYEQAEKDLADVAQFSSGPDGFFYGKGYQQAKKDLGWISVKDRLPEKGHFVLTCVADTGTPQCVGMAILLDDCTWWDGDIKVCVDYWMEVPKFNEAKK